jgi:hypothetical protein
MLRYRAASFFANLNCPELTLGIYTQEEYEDNDFRTTPAETKTAIKNEIQQSANSEDFEPNVIDAEVKPVEEIPAPPFA